MSSVIIITIFVILFTIFPSSSSTNASDFLVPHVTPHLYPIGSICNAVDCGMGECKTSDESDFEYECECYPGWKKSAFTDTYPPKHSPCVVPNSCNWVNCGGGLCHEEFGLSYVCKCNEGYNSANSNIVFPCFNECLGMLGRDCSNLTLFLPTPPNQACHWVNCGGGLCNEGLGLNHACKCNEGYKNLLNNTALPCFKECLFGGDCLNPPNQAKSLQHEAVLIGMLVIGISIAPLLHIF